MKKTVASLFITSVIAGMSMVSAVQAADAEGGYVGAGIGWTQYTDIERLSNNYDRNTTSYRAFGGYTFNDYLGLEAGYDWFGNAQVNDKDFTAQSLNLSVIPRVPLIDKLSLFGEVGLAGWDVSNDDRDVSKKHFAPVYGVGLAYRISDPVDVMLRYRIMDDAGNGATGETDIATLGLELAYYPTRSSAPAPVAAPAPAPAPAPVMETKKFTLTSDVLFDFGKASLKPAGVAALTKLYADIQELQMQDKQTVVYGYTDRIGSDQANQSLSERRAKSVADFLIGKGMEPSMITAVGKGEADPVTGTQCDSVKNRQKLIVCLAPDRRVSVEVKGVKEVVVKP